MYIQNKKQCIVAVITAITGDRVIVYERELIHALNKHFSWLPRNTFLELLEQVLKDPTEIYKDNSRLPSEFRLFYRIENGNYLVAVIKIIESGTFFSSMYPTGSKIRNPHKKLVKVKI